MVYLPQIVEEDGTVRAMDVKLQGESWAFTPLEQEQRDEVEAQLVEDEQDAESDADKRGKVMVASARVGGACSSIRAEAAAMWMAISTLDSDTIINLYTDSMNVIDALRKWQRKEFLADMRQQKHADIMMPLLEALNARTKETHIIKVKSHRGVELNELADREAGVVIGDKEADLIFADVPSIGKMRFTWEGKPKWDPKLKVEVTEKCEALTTAAVHKRWLEVARGRAVQRCERERLRKQGRWVAEEREDNWLAPFMLTHEFMLHEGWGHNLLHQSRAQRPWSAEEERTWMQHVTRTLPVNSYLHRIGKHPTGDCDWCAGKRETITHFQTECSEHHGARHAAHNLIWQTLLAGLERHAAPGWKFYRETTFDNLPFEFDWKDMEELADEEDRQPDGVAYHAVSKKLYLLEFTRAMDHSHTLGEAAEKKGKQYTKAMVAFRKSQRRMGGPGDRIAIDTLPFVYGVRGSLLEQECIGHMHTLGVIKRTVAQDILAEGVQAAVQACYNMKLARGAALKELREKADVQLAARVAAKTTKTVKKAKRSRTRKGV